MLNQARGLTDVNTSIRKLAQNVDQTTTDLENRMRRIEGDVNALGGRLDATDINMGELRGHLQANEAAVGEISGRLTTTNTNVDALGEQIARNQTDVDILSRRLDANDRNVGTLNDQLNGIYVNVGALGEQLEGDMGELREHLEGDMDNLAEHLYEDMKRLSKQIATNETALQARIEQLEGKVNDLDESKADKEELADAVEALRVNNTEVVRKIQTNIRNIVNDNLQAELTTILSGVLSGENDADGNLLQAFNTTIRGIVEQNEPEKLIQIEQAMMEADLGEEGEGNDKWKNRLNRLTEVLTKPSNTSMIRTRSAPTSVPTPAPTPKPRSVVSLGPDPVLDPRTETETYQYGVDNAIFNIVYDVKTGIAIITTIGIPEMGYDVFKRLGLYISGENENTKISVQEVDKTGDHKLLRLDGPVAMKYDKSTGLHYISPEYDGYIVGNTVIPKGTTFELRLTVGQGTWNPWYLQNFNNEPIVRVYNEYNGHYNDRVNNTITYRPQQQ